MLPIVAAIVASTAAGVWAEHRYQDQAGVAARRGLSFVLYIVLPPAIFFNLADADLDANAGLGVAFGVLALALTAIAAWAIGAKILHLKRPATGALIASNLVPNSGYLGYPVVAALLGLDALGEAVAYDVLVSGPGLLLGAFAVGAAFGDRAGEGIRERTQAFFLRNPPLYAAIAALLAPDALAPDLLVDASRVIVIAILPLGFFAVGAALAEEAEERTVGFPPSLDAPVIAAVALKLLLAPALLYLIALPFIELPDAYLLLATMPCGLNTMIVAHAYGLDVRITAGAIAWSTALSVTALSAAALFT
jgi:malate permease and related proteins